MSLHVQTLTCFHFIKASVEASLHLIEARLHLIETSLKLRHKLTIEASVKLRQLMTMTASGRTFQQRMALC
jgi:hypothetical protein